MRRPRTGGILGPDIVDAPCGILFWDTIRVLGHHLDQLVSLDHIVNECHRIYGDSDDYEIRQARRQVQNAISKLKQEGFVIESIPGERREGKQIAYCWAGERIDKKKK